MTSTFTQHNPENENHNIITGNIITESKSWHLQWLVIVPRVYRKRCLVSVTIEVTSEPTFDGTKWVARPHFSISAPSNLAPTRATYSPGQRHGNSLVKKVTFVINQKFGLFLFLYIWLYLQSVPCFHRSLAQDAQLLKVNYAHGNLKTAKENMTVYSTGLHILQLDKKGRQMVTIEPR